MSDDAWTYSEEPVSSLHIGPCAECGRLREQLDAARQISARLRVNSIAWHRRFHIGRWQECSEPSCVTDRAARAALGVVGEQE